MSRYQPWFLAILVAGLGAPRLASASCPSGSIGSFYRSASRSWSGGDYNTFWSRYAFSGYIKGTDQEVLGRQADELELDANLTADARIFGIQRQLARANAHAYSVYGSSAGGSINLYAVGVNIYSRSWSTNLSLTRSYDRTFFSAVQYFTLAGIPIRVTETAGGELGFTLSGGPTTSGVGVNFDPFARAYAEGTAGVDVYVTGVGVGGEITLIEITIPFDGRIDLAGNALTASLDVDSVLSTLDGRTYVWLKIWPTTWKHTIIDWDGYSSTTNIRDGSWSYVLCNPSGGGGGGGGGGPGPVPM